MRIAFFGGSFDPPHRGHLAIARAALQRLHLERILFAPVGRQPLKHAAAAAPASSYEDRCAMVELATAASPGLTAHPAMADSAFVLSRLDAPKANGEPNYTVDTLQRLKATLAPADELFCLVGADAFLTLRQWRHATELLLTYDFIVATRPGFSLVDLAGALPDSLAATLTRIEPDKAGTDGYQLFRATEDSSECEPDPNESGQGKSSRREAKIYLLPGLDEDISATQIRAAVASHSAGEDLLQPSVVSYIEEHALYRLSASR